MDDRERRLAAIPWFASLPPPVREALVARGRWQRRPAGEWLYGEGDEDTGVTAVIEGALHLYSQAPGDREALFNALPAGAVFGQSALFGGGPRLVTAICAVDSLVFLLPDQALRQVAAAHPSLWESLSTLVYGQLRAVVQGLAEFVALRPRERMISRLITLSASGSRVATSQAALAEMVGVSRGAVNGWLTGLEAGGKIACGYGWIDVVDREGLRRMLNA